MPCLIDRPQLSMRKAFALAAAQVVLTFVLDLVQVSTAGSVRDEFCSVRSADSSMRLSEAQFRRFLAGAGI